MISRCSKCRLFKVCEQAQRCVFEWLNGPILKEPSDIKDVETGIKKQEPLKPEISLYPEGILSIQPYIRIAFQGDSQLFEKYATKNGTYEEVVEDVYAMIKEIYSTKTTNCFSIRYNKIPVGFTVIVVGNSMLLYSFGVNIVHRTAGLLKAWLNELKINFGNYRVALNIKNTRAINFFKKNGFEEDEEATKFVHDKNVIVLCQSILEQQQ